MSDINSFYCPGCEAHSNLSLRQTYEKYPLKYTIEECNNCEMFFIVTRNSSNDILLDISPQTLPGVVNELVPAPIKEDFAEALLCYSVGAYRGAAALARRTVQVICLEKGANKDMKLQHQIDELFTNGIITKDIQDWAHEVRFLGNDAAHPNKNDVTEEDAKDILELLESLCEVLYVTPAKAAERKKKREEKK